MARNSSVRSASVPRRTLHSLSRELGTLCPQPNTRFAVIRSARFRIPFRHTRSGSELPTGNEPKTATQPCRRDRPYWRFDPSIRDGYRRSAISGTRSLLRGRAARAGEGRSVPLTGYVLLSARLWMPLDLEKGDLNCRPCESPIRVSVRSTRTSRSDHSSSDSLSNPGGSPICSIPTCSSTSNR